MKLPFIVKLLRILNEKEDILEAMQKLVQPIAKIVEDPAKAYEDEYEAIILKHQPFHKDTGFLLLVTRLIVLNDDLVQYRDGNDRTSIRQGVWIDMNQNLAKCGEEVHRMYVLMMELVKKEQ